MMEREPSYVIRKPDGTFVRRYHTDFGRYYELAVQPEGALMEDQTEYQTGEKIAGGKPESEWTESLTQMAEGAGLYFKALKKSEIPHDLAIRLVEEWHRIQWESVFRGA